MIAAPAKPGVKTARAWRYRHGGKVWTSGKTPALSVKPLLSRRGRQSSNMELAAFTRRVIKKLEAQSSVAK